jgi:predicted Fe-Mo cluster-binding NifX family protein
VLVADALHEPILSPFFAKCDGLLIVDLDAEARTFHANAKHTSQSICELILESGVTRLVCGFIAEPEKKKLSTAGIDVRVGSCQRSVEDLVNGFAKLPQA